jgi:hypothetical protein
VGGWEVSGIHKYQSGVPIRISTRASIPTLGSIWAIRIPGVPIRTGVNCGNYDINNPNTNEYLNFNAFSTPGPFSFGNTSVLPSTRTCGYSNEDLSLIKNFPITERVRLRFGWDLFNAFNRHIWSAPDTDMGDSANFGRIFGATGPRTMQLHLKLDF